mmetsp:Transcript_102704/g.290949  ORF Transcript_102704/g.290949 Transcript_102704/m.290949 type:complete len:248 (-) Transcript_102704:462-1205(-)
MRRAASKASDMARASPCRPRSSNSVTALRHWGQLLQGSTRKNRTSAYNSSTQFCNGVPVMHQRHEALKRKAACATRLERFLMEWASSRMTRVQKIWKRAPSSFSADSVPYVVSTTPKALKCCALIPLRPEPWYSCTVGRTLAGKCRLISSCHWVTRDTGMTTRVPPTPASPLGMDEVESSCCAHSRARSEGAAERALGRSEGRSRDSRAKHMTVLPRPMSSASTPPRQCASAASGRSSDRAPVVRWW